MDDYNVLTKTARFCLLDENEIIAGGISKPEKLSRSKGTE